MEETIQKLTEKQLHYTVLCQNIQKRKGISSCCERSQSQQVRHTLTGHFATPNTEHRKNMARRLLSRQNKQGVADFKSNSGNICLCLVVYPS